MAATLPAYGVTALGLWNYLIPAVLIVLVAIWCTHTKGRIWLGSYYLFATCVGVVVQSLALNRESVMALALPVWIVGAAIAWTINDEVEGH
jgi:hypothetical protein